MNLLTQQQDPCAVDLTALFGTIDAVDVEELQDLFCQTNMTALFIRMGEEVNMALLLPLVSISLLPLIYCMVSCV